MRRRIATPALMVAAFGSCAMVAPQPPVDPLYADAETVLQATVNEVVGTRGDAGAVAKLRSQKVFHGKPISGVIIVKLTACFHGVAPLAVGQSFVFYIDTDVKDGRRSTCQWTSLEHAKQEDPFVAAWSQAVSSSSRAKLLRRAAEVNHFKGPVPASDMRQWMLPSRGRSYLGYATRVPDKNHIRAHFKVDPDGHVSRCTAMWMGSARLHSPSKDIDMTAICDALEEKARFKPPLLPMERRGTFFWVN